MLKFIVKNKHYEIPKNTLIQEMKLSEQSRFDRKNNIQLPNWIEPDEFEPIYSYLSMCNKIAQFTPQNRTQKIKEFLYYTIKSKVAFNTTKKLIQIMKISDYLTLQTFQQYFFHQCVIKGIDQQNSVAYLEQTHKKIKNSVAGAGTAQVWFSLLNACIDFISRHLTEVYLIQPQRIQNLHQKILSEILDRTIKYLRSSTSENRNNKDPDQQKDIIFNLLMKSKKVNSVDALCNAFKSSLINKKINEKMHAKLSWKLHDLDQIAQKKIKSFKFLDYNWILEATRAPDCTIKIKLCLQKNVECNLPVEGDQVAVFYKKLYWSIEDYQSGLQTSASSTYSEQYQTRPQLSISGQQPLCIDYICFKNPSQMTVFIISNQFQRKVRNKNLQLSIFCSIDQSYSFAINYIINQYERTKLDEKKIQKEEIYALIQGSKFSGKYSQAVWLIKYLAKNQLQIPLNLLQNFSPDKLPTYQVQFLKKLIRPQSVSDEQFSKKQLYSKVFQIQNQTSSCLQISQIQNINDNLQTKSNNNRPLSRSRHRKIFDSSPLKQFLHPIEGTDNKTQNPSQLSEPLLKSIQLKKKQQQIPITNSQQKLQLHSIMQIINLKNYFFDKNSSFASTL